MGTGRHVNGQIQLLLEVDSIVDYYLAELRLKAQYDPEYHHMMPSVYGAQRITQLQTKYFRSEAETRQHYYDIARLAHMSLDTARELARDARGRSERATEQEEHSEFEPNRTWNSGQGEGSR